MKRIIIYPILIVLMVSMILSGALTQRVASAASSVTINGGVTFQTIDGFGASGAFRAASHIHGSTGLSASQQQAILDLLFSPNTGAGLSIWRNQIGSSSNGNDGDSVLSIEPNNPGGPNATPTYVWDGNDADQLWISQQAQARGVSQFYADAWGAPAYMKTNNSLTNGGYLCGVPGRTCSSGDWRQHYANYLVQYLKFYKDAGINITYVGYQNEPDLSPSYTGMNWDAANVAGDRGAVNASTPQNIDFIKNFLGPTLANSGLTTRIACCDATSWDRANVYASGVLADASARNFVGLITGHGYYASSTGLLGPNPINSAASAGKQVWQTEAADFTTWNAAWDSGGSNTTGFHWAQNLWDALVNARVSAYLYWWGAKAYTAGGATANSPLIKIVDNTFEPSKRLWAFANFSRFIRPGAVRIDATTSNSNLKVTAARNSDGSTAVVVLNAASAAEAVTFNLQGVTGGSAVPFLTNESNSTAQQPAVSISGGAFNATVPARSLVTYRIAAGGQPTVTPTRTATTGPSPTATRTPTPGTPTATPGANVLTNGNIESGTTGWSVFGSGTLAANTSVVHGGSRSLSISGRTAAWNGPSQSVTSKLTNGKSYTTSVWVRTQSGTPSAKVTLQLTANGSTSFITLAPARAVNSSAWTLLSGSATVSWSGTLSSATFYVETSSGTDSFFIDDASFQ